MELVTDMRAKQAGRPIEAALAGLDGGGQSTRAGRACGATKAGRAWPRWGYIAAS